MPEYIVSAVIEARDRYLMFIVHMSLIKPRAFMRILGRLQSEAVSVLRAEI